MQPLRGWAGFVEHYCYNYVCPTDNSTKIICVIANLVEVAEL